MRPRRIAAENVIYTHHAALHDRPSMRPRRIAAENLLGFGLYRSTTSAFNEAAANRRGKPLSSITVGPRQLSLQ